jgi:hypothetical protein
MICDHESTGKNASQQAGNFSYAMLSARWSLAYFGPAAVAASR